MGGIVGSNYGSVSKCYSTCTIDGIDYIGGIAGKNDGSRGNSIVENCYSTGDIIGTNYYTGGVVGYNGGSSGNAFVKKCYSTGTVGGGTYVGGVVGWNSPSNNVEKCVALGPNVNNKGGSIGRVIGANDSGNSLSNYARYDMLFNEDPIDFGDIEPFTGGSNVGEYTHEDGDGIGGYYNEYFWKTTMEWGFEIEEVWEMHNVTKLPILKGFPEGTQTPVIQSPTFTEFDAIKYYLENQSGGNDADNAINLQVDINLGNMQEDSDWERLLKVISEAGSTGKYVNLDLSDCDMDTDTFVPNTNASDGREKIVKLTLPTKVKNITSGSDSLGTFENFETLESISGENVSIIGSSAFASCTALENVNFPNVTLIGDSAFYSCTSLISAIFDNAKTIRDSAFYLCKKLESISLKDVVTIDTAAFEGCIALESVTLGDTAPALGTYLFEGNSSQTITVKVPLAATGYSPYPGINIVSDPDTTETWANGFRGGGWNTASSALIDSSLINQDITLNFSAY